MHASDLRGAGCLRSHRPKGTELVETVYVCIYVCVAGTQWGNTSTNDGTLGTTDKRVKMLVEVCSAL